MNEVILKDLATNTKIAGYSTNWQKFQGFSLLFDTPGKHEITDQLISASGPNSALKLFRVIDEAFKTVQPDPTTSVFAISPVPYHTYHVTVWDGINDGNIKDIDAENRDFFEQQIHNLPGSLLEAEDYLRIIDASPLVTDKNWSITFKFKRVAPNIQRQAIVAYLEPANDSSEKLFERLVEERKKLYLELDERFKTNLYVHNKNYHPHVSLGYFGDYNKAINQALAIQDTWNEQFEKVTQDLTVTFKSISLYGFDNMVRFYNKEMVPLLKD